ncbi:MAG: carbon storage regulator CsrA [Verrucomicrobiales bacterium]|nr:carbon storage regulator CsrA [Verrucomicrobiales bacterium]
MLILSRKVNENIVIDGRIIVKIVRLDGENVKLGIEAPPDVPVHRQEVYDEIQRNNREAATTGRRPVPRLSKNKPGSHGSALNPPVSGGPTVPPSATPVNPEGDGNNSGTKPL